MDDAADLSEPPVQARCVGVSDDGRRLALDDPAIIQRHNHQVLGPELVVGHAAGLDDEDAGVAVDAAGVAE